MWCYLQYGDNSVDPPVPAKLYIPMSSSVNGYPSAFNMHFTIANIRNPPLENMNVGVTIKMFK